MQIGYHPEKDVELFRVRPERMKQYMTIPKEETRYWFALNDWLDEMDISACYHMWPEDGDELFQRTKAKLSEIVKRDGLGALGEFKLLAEEFMRR